MLTVLLRVVGVIQLVLGGLYLAAPGELLAGMGHSAIAPDIRYPLGMLAARFVVYGAALIYAARQPQAHRPWIWGMVGIQLIDLAVGAAYTASGVLPLRLSGFPMFNALWISALLAYSVWRLPAASPARGPASDAAS